MWPVFYCLVTGYIKSTVGLALICVCVCVCVEGSLRRDKVFLKRFKNKPKVRTFITQFVPNIHVKKALIIWKAKQCFLYGW